MGVLDKIKSTFKQGSEETHDVVETITKSGKKIVENVTDKATDMASMAKLKYELSSFSKTMDAEYLNLGNILLTVYASNEFDTNKTFLINHIKAIEEFKKTLQAKQLEYDRLREEYSKNYVISQFSEELATSSNGTIEKAIVSEKSNVVGKTLKKIQFPKETLLIGIIRDNQFIFPDGNTQIRAGDGVFIIGNEDDVGKVLKRFLGGGNKPTEGDWH